MFLGWDLEYFGLVLVLGLDLGNFSRSLGTGKIFLGILIFVRFLSGLRIIFSFWFLSRYLGIFCLVWLGFVWGFFGRDGDGS